MTARPACRRSRPGRARRPRRRRAGCPTCGCRCRSGSPAGWAAGAAGSRGGGTGPRSVATRTASVRSSCASSLTSSRSSGPRLDRSETPPSGISSCGVQRSAARGRPPSGPARAGPARPAPRPSAARPGAAAPARRRPGPGRRPRTAAPAPSVRRSASRCSSDSRQPGAQRVDVLGELAEALARGEPQGSRPSGSIPSRSAATTAAASSGDEPLVGDVSNTASASSDLASTPGATRRQAGRPCRAPPAPAHARRGPREDDLRRLHRRGGDPPPVCHWPKTRP